jgi:hypothetical protein
MRELSGSEASLIEERRKGLAPFVGESLPVLFDFLRVLGFDDPRSVTINAQPFVAGVDSWLRFQDVRSEDRIWIITRIAYLLGELFRQRYHGRWVLDEDAASVYFLQYVIGDFPPPLQRARISPAGLAANYVDAPSRRSLVDIVSDVDTQVTTLAQVDGCMVRTEEQQSG